MHVQAMRSEKEAGLEERDELAHELDVAHVEVEHLRETSDELRRRVAEDRRERVQ